MFFKPLYLIAVVCLYLLGTGVISAQTFYPIENGTITTCEGVFTDDGTGEGAPYQPGQTYTFTICPDTPGDVVSVEFLAFALYTSPNPNNSDYLAIFDGDSDAAPSLGSYTGNNLQGLPVTGTVNNTTGCLTFVFHSNPNGPGNLPGWEANITCTTPCATPTAASEIVNPAPENPGIPSIGVCLDAPVTFGDNGSFAEPGFNLDYYIWNYDDGTIDTVTSATDVTHTFTEPGEYLVNLAVVDNNGCRSLNVDPLQILVSTIPIFNTNFETPVCVGSDVQLDGNPVQSITWTALPPQVVAGETYLADGAGFTYNSTLTFDFFEPGATLDNCNDLLDVFVNMEHSYMGDLQISITCPDGTNVVMLPYPNSGGNTFFGEAVDDGSQDPGVGYNYGWSPTSTNGYIDDDANATNTTFIDATGASVTNDIANPGFYQSEEDLCNLVGCPLNGDWTFNVLDNLGIDNGYVFQWGIDFNPALFPDITTFTPIIGLGPDSTYWTGPNIESTSADGNIIHTSFDSPGSYNYTFTAINNFGCSFDTTITVEVIEGPDITAGPDLTYCTDPVTLEAGLADYQGSCGEDSGTYEYCYENGQNISGTYCPDNPGDGVTFMEFVINSGSVENFFDEFFVYDGDDTSAPLLAGPLYGDLSGQFFIATNPTGCITWQITPDNSVSCGSGSQTPLNISVSCGGGSGLVWSWSPATGLSDPNIQNPTAQVNQATTYTVAAYPIGFPGCVITDQVVVAPDALSNPGIDTDTTICYNSPISNLTGYLNGNPVMGGVWTDNDNQIENSFNPSQYPDGGNFTYVYTITNGTCEGTSTLNLTVLPATDATCCQTNAMAGPDAIPCSLEYQLQADNALGVGTWSGPPEITFSDIHDPHAVATCTQPGGGSFTLTWTDNNGFLCSASDDIVVHFSDPMSLIVIPQDAVCYNQCSGNAVAIPDGGTTSNGTYTYDWYENGSPGLTPQIRDSLCSGFYMVKVYDNLGCSDSATFEIGQPAAQDIFVTKTPPLCMDSCNGQIAIQSEGAVRYSFDDGVTFQENNRAAVCAGKYTVVAQNEAGCNIKEQVSLINPAKYEAMFNINPKPATTKNTLITFQDVSSPGPVNKSEYTFGLDPVLGESNQRIATFRFPSDTSGTYPVRLISTSQNGCIDTLIQHVIIENELLFYIPNSFTPNGDGINDIWRPISRTMSMEDYELTVVNRWGQTVFQTTDYYQGWNGSNMNDGYFVDAGVYTYLIKVTSATTKEKLKFTGSVTVTR